MMNGYLILFLELSDKNSTYPLREVNIAIYDYDKFMSSLTNQEGVNIISQEDFNSTVFTHRIQLINPGLDSTIPIKINAETSNHPEHKKYERQFYIVINSVNGQVVQHSSVINNKQGYFVWKHKYEIRLKSKEPIIMENPKDGNVNSKIPKFQNSKIQNWECQKMKRQPLTNYMRSWRAKAPTPNNETVSNI